MAQVVAIVNPASSSGRTLERLPQLETELRARFPEVEVQHTEAPGHATLLSRAALEAGARTVVSVGGDGTNNEVLCGFMDDAGRNRFPDAELGLVSSGTGSDFQRYLRRDGAGDRDPAEPRPVDYGVIEFHDHQGRASIRPFLNEASAGVSGFVDYQVGRSNKTLGPTATYVMGALKAIAGYRNHRVRVVIEEGAPREVDLTLAVLANGQYFGGGMWIAPKARCDDGHLDLVLATGLSRLRMVEMLARIFRGAHVGRPGVETGLATIVRLEATDPSDVVLLDVDGEQPGRLPARVEIVPAGLRLRPSVIG